MARGIGLTAPLMALLLLATGTAVAGGGGWSTVHPDPRLEPRVGEETLIGFTVLQHGRTPLGGLQPRVKLAHAASGARAEVLAHEAGPRGHYLARVVFPREGEWAWSVEAFEGDHPLPTLNVSPAATGASGPNWALPLSLAALGAVAALLVARPLPMPPAVWKRRVS